VIQESIKEKEEEIEDVKKEEGEENWTENDKKELIEEYMEENYQYQKMVERITSGHVPSLNFETYSTGACCLDVKDIIILNIKNKMIRLLI